ncbi:MAG: ABC transporter ATP-binding protein, partial [Clostridia bacterium]|nr:ABC transporter ATP-binding protein [Clostridia bacterium]
MIRLDNVSKFYYSKGVIAAGFSKVSLNFDIGEFVAITGESGSGKSTLLNVISGLDTYEEGEMYINGEETSHYTEKDFEDYRRKYIGNIFQSFNLVNSYTVYQNIELVMLLNGSKRKEIKARVNELIDTVGLTEYKHTKASKLSGGQKQRVAIARALAKDTPIIIADEPTGNLDTESAAGIIELLASIAKDKLVIVVTHNFDQVAPYVTRKIKMHDGKVLEDVRMNQDTVSAEPEQPVDYAVSYKNIRPLSELRLGIRNAFNIPVKFILI